MMKKAFTLLELVLVITVFGIIAAIGADIYVKIYENYLISRVMNSLQTKTELVLDQLAKRLQYRIKDATIGRKTPANGSAILPASSGNLDSSYKILEWIGYDGDGMRGNWSGTFYTPIWNGFADVEDSNKTHIFTPGSALSLENGFIQQFSHNNANINDAAIVFLGRRGDYDITKYGWYPGSGIQHSEYVYSVTDYNDTVLQIVDATQPDEISERYKLVWSAYAVAPDPIECEPQTAPNGECNLTLYTDFQPWLGQRYNDGNASKYLLLEHVTTFRFRQDGDVLHLKLCVQGFIAEQNLSICKEKVVF